jgi:hypothetical protein
VKEHRERLSKDLVVLSIPGRRSTGVGEEQRPGLLAKILGYDGEPMQEPDPAVIGQDGAIQNFMGEITRHARASNGYVLELGCGKGTGSTLAIQRGLKNHPTPLHISVDIQFQLEWRPQVDWWFFVKGDTRDEVTYDAVEGLAGRQPGLIFMDTQHNGDQMRRELELWSPMATKSTVWLFHDPYMWEHPNMYDRMHAISVFAHRNGWTYEDYRTEQHGLGRMMKS